MRDESKESEVSHSPLATRHSPFLTWVVGLSIFVVYLLAASTMSPGWDEGYTWKRIEALEPWMRRWFQPDVGVGEQLSKATLDRVWQFSREEPDGHGPFYALLSYAGHVLTNSFLSPPLSYRVGSIALFAFACAVLFRCLEPRWGRFLSLVAVGLLATQPRLTPEVCFGVVDGPLVSLALLTYCAFLAALERTSLWRIALFGLPAGAAMATKLTGWVLLGPYIAFVILTALGVGPSGLPMQRALKTVCWGLVVAAATCLLINVGWWLDPIDGLVRFFRSNLTRDETTHIPNYFMGRTYEFSLPWYNTLVWSAVAMSPVTLVLGVVGLFVAIRRRTPELITAALVWAAIVVVRSLPNAPGHDGVRQIVVAFAFLSILAAGALTTTTQSIGKLRAFLGLLALAISTIGNAIHHPVQLSYYSPFVGALKGGSKYFEPTYFWDALTPEAVRWLNENTPPGRSILFASNPENWKYLHGWRILKPPPWSPDLDPRIEPMWYVLQHRTAMLRPGDRRLIETEKPEYVVSRFGVTLVGVYSIEQYRRNQDEGRRTMDENSDGR